MNRRTALGGTIAATALLALAACGDTAATDSPSSAATGDIVDVAVAAGSFETLVAAVTAAGLVDTLKGPGPFTVFAPTDAAFAAMPAGTVESLLKPENRDQLTAILTYHVVPGRFPASSFAGQRGTAATVQGGSLHIDGRSGVTVENATVVTADVAASNGVIHVIDAVMLPD
jgi:uncharacterized surface protein with fasciclin (FAS1) repeats